MPAFRLLISFCLSLLLLFPKTGNSQECLDYRNLCIQTGDLIFVGAKAEQLSGAINRVTQRDSNVSFDHVGILEIVGSQVYILHASTEKGSVSEPLDSLVARTQVNDKKLVLYRLQAELQAAIPQTITTAKSLLGKPYNWSYVLNDSSLYCSDLVERAFRHAEVFSLEPMTFINPESGKTDAYWLEFYEKLGIPVPEGKLGCNPNGLAANDNLQLIGELSR